MTSSEKLNVALFGLGRVGQVHFSNLLNNERVCVKHILELDVERADEVLHQFHLEGQIPVTSIEKVEQVLSDESIHAVLICTPNNTHEELILAGLNHGKAVFCENPLSSSVLSVIQCCAEAKRVNLPLICGLNRRFDPQIQRLYTRVKDGNIGAIRTIKITCREPKTMTTRNYLRLSGGIFIDSAVHDVDLACYIVGEYPVSVFAQGNTTNELYKKCEEEDSCLMILKFPCGALASLEISKETNIGFYHKIEVLGQDGLLESENKRSLDIVHWDHTGVKLEPVSDNMDRYSESFKLEMEHAINIIQGRSKCGSEDNKSTIVCNIIAAAGKASIQCGSQIILKTFAQEEYNYDI